MAKRRAKRRGPGKRYTVAQKAKILAAAKEEGLTGAQVAKRFGVSTLTFYRWRGPVRRRRRGPGRPKGSKNRVAVSAIGSSPIRDHVRAEVKRVLPDVVRQEVAAYLKQILG